MVAGYCGKYGGGTCGLKGGGTCVLKVCEGVLAFGTFVQKLLGLLACGGRGAWCGLGGNGGVFTLRVGVPTCNVDSDRVVGDCELLIDVREVLGACC